jgi:peptidoglycan hydrolase-like protein with peptidoglycan-binding domain
MNVEPWMDLASGDPSHGVVRAAQHLLNAAGAGLVADGIYGVQTGAAVSDRQIAQGLRATGVIDPPTWIHLIRTARRGDTGDVVRAVQSIPPASVAAPPLTVDGVFGPETESYVEYLQRLYGLRLDGVVGRQTWSFAQALRPGVVLWPLVAPSPYQRPRAACVQHLLNAAGASLEADGIYGPLTGQATRAFQQSLRALYIGTVVGQLDWPALIQTVGEGSTGDVVRAVQVLLGGLTVDGVFGPQTRQSVEFAQSFQLATPVDGVVGPQTWHAMLVGTHE